MLLVTHKGIDLSIGLERGICHSNRCDKLCAVVRVPTFENQDAKVRVLALVGIPFLNERAVWKLSNSLSAVRSNLEVCVQLRWLNCPTVRGPYKGKEGVQRACA